MGEFQHGFASVQKFSSNVNPGLINAWLINRGCPLVFGFRPLLEGFSPP